MAGFVVSLVDKQETQKHHIHFAVVSGLVCVAMLVLQRVVPYRRTWIFLCPLYYIYAAAGVHIVLARLGMSTGKVVSGVALLYAATISGLVVYNNGTTIHSDQGTLFDAFQITQEISQHLKAGDRIMVQPPADYPIRYHLEKMGLSVDVMEPVDPDANRLFYIRNKEANFSKSGEPRYQSLETACEYFNLHCSHFSKQELWRKYPYADVYLLMRNLE